MTDERDYGGNERIESLTNDLGSAFESRRGFLKKGATASAVGLGLSAGAGSAVAADDETTTEGEGSQKYVDTLNYALTLERLEATFYVEGLQKFSESEIEDSEIGQKFGDKVQASIQEQLATIRDHEKAHVETLVKTINDLGGDPIGEDELEFQFPLESPEGFIETAQTLETTGVSAYDGAINLLSGSDQLLTAAATIATVEGRHSAYLNGLTGKSPFPRAFDEAKPPEEIMKAIQPFLASEN
ncbi:ferritin-like domain-containing protein [Halorussus limi]|uniref:Ferritin-like domain-containing protein n=1 Tax=Halorussus limi TaxID=2938695 RepID=A0A8U0HWX2_9EURY|nr:ferritin-like domain-containing protein [Halorussus limi]UPV75418.1 ferritin-like domain-containing protein [Halorussus limi]